MSEAIENPVAPPPASSEQPEVSVAAPAKPPPTARRLLLLLPLILFTGLAAVFLSRLDSRDDPSLVPSPLIGRPAPATALPPLPGLASDGKPIDGLDPEAFKGRVTLVNIFASWCAPCREEHPVLEALSADPRFRLVGINYKDSEGNALRFLGQFGNPYAAVGVDVSGRTAIDWGVYGVPETFVVGPDATIRYKFIGPLTPGAVKTELMPAIERALAGSPALSSAGVARPAGG